MGDGSSLISCLMDIERHVGSAGWDQPARLFALVTTSTLLDVEPHLRGRVPDMTPEALTAIEQDDFKATDDLGERLAGIFWPETVEGCALAVERAFLPAGFEDDLPGDDAEAAAFVAAHPAKTDVRVVVGVLRDGSRHGVARLLSDPDELLGADDLVPGLADALAETLRSEEP